MDNLAYTITRTLLQQLLMTALFYTVGMLRVHHVYDAGLIHFWFWLVPLMLAGGHARYVYKMIGSPYRVAYKCAQEYFAFGRLFNLLCGVLMIVFLQLAR
jgi:hypothetical protein